MAPEMTDGYPYEARRADMYSIGQILIFLACGKLVN